MNQWPDHDDRSAPGGFPRTEERRYRATIEALDQAVSRLDVGLKIAGTAPQLDRPRILNDLHRRVRGMGLLLNDALSEYAERIMLEDVPPTFVSR